MKTLADAFHHTLQDVYFAEHALTKALPKVISAVSSKDLKAALKEHLAETKEQIRMLDEVFKSIGEKASGEKCDAIDGPDQGVRRRDRGGHRQGGQARRRRSAAARRSSTTRSPATARCANGPRRSATTRRTSCSRRFSTRRRRRTTALTHLAVTSINQA